MIVNRLGQVVPEPRLHIHTPVFAEVAIDPQFRSLLHQLKVGLAWLVLEPAAAGKAAVIGIGVAGTAVNFVLIDAID